MKKFLLALILAIFTTLSILLLPSNSYAQSIEPTRSVQLPQSTQLNQLTKLRQVKYVRKNAYSPGGKTDLQSLEIALKKMRGLGCQDPTSWYFQGAIHSVPDPSTFTKENPLCPIYTSANTSSPVVQNLLKNYWQKCSHYTDNDNHFLTWHRLYLYHFEQIVRKLSGNPNFAMPYWDYTNTSPVINRSMPQAFWSPSDSTNSLYDSFRQPFLNQGNLIPQDKQNQLITDLKKAYASNRYSTFNSQLESSPHNDMHVYIGGTVPLAFDPLLQNSSQTGHMRNVETAGFDPIFWMHHANIDRYWESWTIANISNPNTRVTEADLNAGEPLLYNFFNGQGNPVSYNNRKAVEAAYNTNYVYDKYDVVPVQASPFFNSRRKLTSLKQTTISFSDVKTKLEDELTTVVLPSPNATTRAAKSPTAVPQVSTDSNGIYELEFQLSFLGNPKGSYKVYVNPPGKNSTIDEDAYYVGEISFFEPSSQERMTKIVRFDITNELAEQVERRGSSLLNQDLTVTFQKQDGLLDQDIVIEKLSFQKFN